MLPKAYLTSHSRMSGSGWVIIPSWLSGSWRSFLYSSMYSYHFFLISSASVRSMPFLSFIVPIFAWNIPFVSLIFLKRSLVFPILLFHLFLCIVYLGSLSFLPLLFFGTLHSDRYIFPFRLPFASLLFSVISKSFSDNHFAIYTSFPWGWFWSLPPVQCYKPPCIVL